MGHMWVSGSDKQQGGKILASSPFSEAKGTVSESGDGAQNTGREAARAHLVPGASGGGVRVGPWTRRSGNLRILRVELLEKTFGEEIRRG